MCTILRRWINQDCPGNNPAGKVNLSKTTQVKAAQQVLLRTCCFDYLGCLGVRAR